MNSDSAIPLDNLLKNLTAAADTPFESTTPMPAAVYHSEAFHQLEHEKVFSNARICVGREDEISKLGDYLAHEISKVSVIVIRQQDNSIKGFVNACAHRFACLLKTEKGSAKKITCPYHAWTYNPAGELIRSPYMEMKSGFDQGKIKLKELPVECWQGFIFVSLNTPDEESLEKVLAPLTDNIVGRYQMPVYQTVLRETMTWNANWKNLVENYTESYHVPMAHGKTFAQHDKSLADYVCGEDNLHYGYHRAAKTSDEGPGSAHPANQRLEGEWRRMMIDFCIFPGMLVTLMPDYLWYVSVQPDGINRFKATWGVAIPPEVLSEIPEEKHAQWVADFKTYIDIANDEDKLIVEALHKGTSSSILPRGQYHPLERNLWQFNRYLASKCHQPSAAE
jgi:choline monooxygenase